MLNHILPSWQEAQPATDRLRRLLPESVLIDSSGQERDWPKPIVERISQPSPEEVREARERVGLTQTQAAWLVSSAVTAGYKTWAGYEQPVGARNHRAIPLAVWELFLLLTGQHPTMRVVYCVQPTDRRLDNTRC